MQASCEPNDLKLVSIINETPLCLAPYTQVILDKIVLKPNMRALNVGCGWGSPAFELAQCLGPSSQVHITDPWQAALDRFQLKQQQMGIGNVVTLPAKAEALPIADNVFDLIVSNQGLHCAANPTKAWQVCYRVAKPGAQVVITENTSESLPEFYDCLRSVLKNLGQVSCLSKLDKQITSQWQSWAETQSTIEGSGFHIVEKSEHSFRLRFLDGTALLNHFLIRHGFLDDWSAIVPESQRKQLFKEVESRLNEQVQQTGELSLTVSFRCIDAEKPVH